MDTTTATVSPVVTRRPRIKDALASGIIDTTKSVTKAVDSGADIIGAVAVRIKLHNISCAADLIDELGSDKVNQAQQLISNL